MGDAISIAKSGISGMNFSGKGTGALSLRKKAMSGPRRVWRSPRRVIAGFDSNFSQVTVLNKHIQISGHNRRQFAMYTTGPRHLIQLPVDHK